jgi:hypothetical protein
MSISIETAGFCPQYGSTWEVPGSNGAVWTVKLDGAQGAPYCTCPRWKFQRKATNDRTCKHIDRVMAHACLFNPQWHETPGPNDYAKFGIRLIGTDTSGQVNESCPGCGQNMIAVKIAV